MGHLLYTHAVVPYYFLVWYNASIFAYTNDPAVVPYYFLVWYNWTTVPSAPVHAVVPYYFLVWYNQAWQTVSS